MASARPISVSFSGIDGAGKSTQIHALRLALEHEGMRVRIIPFWDEIAALTRLREGAGHRIFKGEKGIGSRISRSTAATKMFVRGPCR